MSSTDTDGGERAVGTGDDAEALAAQIDVLDAENQRLRAENRRVRQMRHRGTALGFAGLGTVALIGAVFFSGVRDVLLALSGTGLFGALLLWAITPERFITASVGERTYEAYATSVTQLIGDLGLTGEHVYVPVDEHARLFIPQHQEYQLPEQSDISRTFIVTDDRRRGVALEPTGNGLFSDLQRDLTDTLAEDRDTLAEQLTDALVDGFELVDSAQAETEPGRLSVALSGYAYGDISGFDHPVPSFVAVGVAVTLDCTVTVEITEQTDKRADALVTCRWEPEE